MPAKKTQTSAPAEQKPEQVAETPQAAPQTAVATPAATSSTPAATPPPAASTTASPAPTEAPVKSSRFSFLGKIRSKKVLFGVIVLVLLALAALPAYYYYEKYNEAQKLVKSGSAQEKEVTEIVESVGKIYELPAETPTIATVSDINKLASQPFFARAQNGDKVLIFKDAKRALIFRPGTGKIVEVGPVAFGEGAEAEVAGASVSGVPSPTVSADVRVVLLNGTTTTGLTRNAEPQITGESDAYKIVDRNNARSVEYEGTIVVNLSGLHSKDAEKLADLLGGSVTSLPEGEAKPANADVLVILGSDFAK